MISFLRTFLNVGRVSNLPTVWSNCLAGWWLSEGGHSERLPVLLAGATSLYLGGAFLNDAFDAPFDQQHRRARPIPAGAIPLGAVRVSGFVLLVLGFVCLASAGLEATLLSAALAGCVLLYNTVHRLVLFSPVLLGLCRFFLYIIATLVSGGENLGRGIWCGLAMACYVVGLGYCNFTERPRTGWDYWPLMFLSAPIILASVMNGGGYLENAWLVSAVLVLWTLQSFRYTFWSNEREPQRTTRRLVAGIMFVDWLAAADAPRSVAALFLLLLVATLALQQWESS